MIFERLHKKARDVRRLRNSQFVRSAPAQISFGVYEIAETILSQPPQIMQIQKLDRFCITSPILTEARKAVIKISNLREFRRKHFNASFSKNFVNTLNLLEMLPETAMENA